MIIKWNRFKDDLFPLELDTKTCSWFIIENEKGQLCFISKTNNIEFTFSKRNRQGVYKIYKNGKLLGKVKDFEPFICQIW